MRNGRTWFEMENEMERKFWYGIWKMPEWNGMEDYLPYQFHAKFCALYLQKKICGFLVGYGGVI